MIVTFDVNIPHEGALLFEAIAAVIREVEAIEDVDGCIPDLSTFGKPDKPSFIPGHQAGCRGSRGCKCINTSLSVRDA